MPCIAGILSSFQGWIQPGIFAHNFLSRTLHPNHKDELHRKSKSNADLLSKGLVNLERNPRRSLITKILSTSPDVGSLLANSILSTSQQHKTLSGVWKKDKSLSDSMHEACELVQLPWVLRKALSVLNRLEIVQTESHFKTVLKAGGLMDVVEVYPFSGDEVLHPRRDKRRGQHRARVRYVDGNNNYTDNDLIEPMEQPHAVCIEAVWDDPFGGWCADTFQLLPPDGNTLLQTTEMKVHNSGKTCKYITIYQRTGRTTFSSQ